MKNIFILLTLLLSLSGCGDDKASIQLIDRAEALLPTHPDSATLLLDSIRMPDDLSEAQLARWCMLYGEASDATSGKMAYVFQLKRARSWFQKHGTADEQARIGLFLGRSYVEDNEYENAMNAYLAALDIALKAAAYNQAGYICSYMADLYGFKDMPELAREKYQEAADYFLKAENKKSYAFALRDVGRMYAFMDSCEVALSYLQQADTVVTALKDTSAMAYIYNGLGNVHNMLEQFDAAEQYHLMSIGLDSLDNAPCYLALAGVSLNKGDIAQARLYLRKANIPTANKDTPTGVLYQYYLIAKKENNISEALSYLEKYQVVADSVTLLQNKVDIVNAENRYNHLKVKNENMQLKANKQFFQLVSISLIAVCLLLFYIYQLIMTRKNRRIEEQQEAISRRDIRLQNISLILQQKEKELKEQAALLVENEELLSFHDSLEDQKHAYKEKQEEIDALRHELLQLKKAKLLSSAIAKKLIDLSLNVIPGATKSPVTEEDWNILADKINEIYPQFTVKLETQIPQITTAYLTLSFLSLLDLKAAQIAVLLHINPDSVNSNRFRLRQKLGIAGENKNLYTYLSEM